MKTPETKEDLTKAIGKLEKANKKWHCPERTALIKKYKEKFQNLQS